jgi:antitoxin component YwqK of YwqJK toxin-antitoxin module
VYWSKNRLCAEVNCINDKKEGIFKNYHDNGQLQEEGRCVNDKKDGISKQYDKNGYFIRNVKYSNGKIMYY